MAATPPSDSKPSGDHKTAGENYVPLTFEEKLNQFWQKNRMAVLGLCALVLIAILGKGAWEKVQESKERDIQSAYQTANTPEQLRSFAAAHPNHPLAAIAEVRIADEAYAAGKYADALAGYEKAIANLKTGPLSARAKLGRALAKVQTGKAAEGTAELKQLADDANQLKALRAEAAYQLASLAADAGNGADAQKYVDQLNQIDPASMWARRAMAIQANLPRPAATPALTAPAATSTSSAAPQKAQSGPSIDLKVPGK